MVLVCVAKAFDKAGARVILHGRSAPKAENCAFSEDTMAITANCRRAGKNGIRWIIC